MRDFTVFPVVANSWGLFQTLLKPYKFYISEGPLLGRISKLGRILKIYKKFRGDGNPHRNIYSVDLSS
jgi:hypothetical protein